jgi:hypothetical protein
MLVGDPAQLLEVGTQPVRCDEADRAQTVKLVQPWASACDL